MLLVAGAIITNNTQSMVNVLTNSAVVHAAASGGILVTGPGSGGELDYRSSHGGLTGCGGVASYSNVTSPSICTSPSDDDQMDGTNDFVSSDNEDISDINRLVSDNLFVENTIKKLNFLIDLSFQFSQLLTQTTLICIDHFSRCENVETRLKLARKSRNIFQAVTVRKR